MKYTMISKTDVDAIRTAKAVLGKLQRRERKALKESTTSDGAEKYDRLLIELDKLGVTVDLGGETRLVCPSIE